MASSRLCCSLTANGSHTTFCLISYGSPYRSDCPTKIDKTKLRNRLRDRLNKLDLDANPEILLKIAEEFNFSEDDIPHIPLTPIDYHDEPGRPHFGPMQVRHASDLKIENTYWIVVVGKRAKVIKRLKIKLKGITFQTFAASDGKDKFEEGIEWVIDFDWLNEDGTVKSRTVDSLVSPTLYLYSIHPNPNKFSRAKTWNDTNYLEFATENFCSCPFE